MTAYYSPQGAGIGCLWTTSSTFVPGQVVSVGWMSRVTGVVDRTRSSEQLEVVLHAEVLNDVELLHRQRAAS